MQLTYRFFLSVLFIGGSVLLVAINYMEFSQWTDKRVLPSYRTNVIEDSPSALATKETKARNDERSKVRNEERSKVRNEERSKVRNEERSKVLTYAKIVIIVAYMRTGSSFLGSVLQEYPGTFYLFEPIRSVWERFLDTPTNSSVQLTYPNGTTRYHSTTERVNTTVDEIKSWLTCKFDRLTMGSLVEGFHRTYTRFMRKLQACAVHKRNSLYMRTQLRHNYPIYKSGFWEICLHRTEQKCREAPMVALKFIRLPMEMIKQLLPLLPNLKVIYLNRDPRGIFNSRSHLKYVREKATPVEIKSYCQRWAGDLKTAEQLSNEYLNKIITVRYENLAEMPHKTFREICDFIGIPYTKEMKKYVIGMSSAASDGCSFCQQRKNSSKTASKWRHELDFTTAQFIYDTCSTGNRLLNYRPFSNIEDMHNLSVLYHS